MIAGDAPGACYFVGPRRGLAGWGSAQLKAIWSMVVLAQTPVRCRKGDCSFEDTHETEDDLDATFGFLSRNW